MQHQLAGLSTTAAGREIYGCAHQILFQTGRITAARDGSCQGQAWRAADAPPHTVGLMQSSSIWERGDLELSFSPGRTKPLPALLAQKLGQHPVWLALLSWCMGAHLHSSHAAPQISSCPQQHPQPSTHPQFAQEGTGQRWATKGHGTPWDSNNGTDTFCLADPGCKTGPGANPKPLPHCLAAAHVLALLPQPQHGHLQGILAERRSGCLLASEAPTQPECPQPCAVSRALSLHLALCCTPSALQRAGASHRHQALQDHGAAKGSSWEAHSCPRSADMHVSQQWP